MAEFLIEKTSKDYKHIDFDFLDEDLMVVYMMKKGVQRRLVGNYILIGHPMLWGMVSMLF